MGGESNSKSFCSFLADTLKTARELYKELPVAEHDAFTDDFARGAIKAFNSVPYNNHSTESKVYLPVDTLIAYAEKPHWEKENIYAK